MQSFAGFADYIIIKMKIIIAGSRDFNDYEFVSKKLTSLFVNYMPDVEIVSGGAKGVDALGERFAKDNNLTCTLFEANWNLYGKAAGPRRNEQMAHYADALVAFWDGKSKGTENMIYNARKYDLQIRIIYFTHTSPR